MRFGLILLAIMCSTVACNKSGNKIDPALEAKRQEIRDAGFPATLEELDAWYPAVADDQNAALDYLKAIETLEKADAEFARQEVLLDATSAEPVGQAFSEPWKEKISAYLAENETSLHHINDGAAKTESRYPMDVSSGVFVEFPYLSDVRSLARLVSLKAFNAVSINDMESFVQSHNQILKIADSLEAEPVLISQLVRLAVIGIGTDNLAETFSRYSIPDAALIRLRDLYSSIDLDDAILLAFAGERVVGAAFIHAAYEGTLLDLFPETEITAEAMELAEFAKENKAALIEREIAHLEAFKPLVENLVPTWTERLALAEKLTESAPATYVPGNVPTELYRAVPAYVRVIMACQSATTAMAVEQFRNKRNRLPVDLLELVPEYLPAVPVDLFDGKLLRYKRESPGYVIYTVFENRQDDGGIDFIRTGNGTEGDFPFRVER